jgi:porin
MLGLTTATALAQEPPPGPSTAPTPAATQPASLPAPGGEQQAFDPSEKLLGDPFNLRSRLANQGITFDPILLVDYTKVLHGGLNTRGESFREHFDFPITFDTEKLVGLKGGTFYIAYQSHNGPNADLRLVGDAQQVTNLTNVVGSRSQLGQLWYQQKFFDDTLRLKVGKMDGGADFEVMEDAQAFLNNSYATVPTLYLMPEFPETATGVEVFYEPKSHFYAGVAVFDGSQGRGFHPGKLALNHAFDRADDLFFIAEAGQRYKLHVGSQEYPGKVAAGAWWDTNPFPRLDGNGRADGTGGVYAILDQLVWKPAGKPAEVSANTAVGQVTAQPQEEDTPGGIAATCSVNWCDPRVNPIDANALVGLAWTGPLPKRPIDILGVGATWAHFSGDYNTRDPYELTFETFYRIRFTQYVSLKPDLQYVIHPTGSGFHGQQLIPDALVLNVRLEMSF